MKAVGRSNVILSYGSKWPTNTNGIRKYTSAGSPPGTPRQDASSGSGQDGSFIVQLRDQYFVSLQ